ncbi:phosphoribosylaminoimidazolesuccinocarboxamide synthase [Anaplasmataceae bacterium AB001_6]|nr:phosphoribosylaminoimidazolesuccinocarboxamide synthase [Anaplasmataceae bacterium AB001_6]
MIKDKKICEGKAKIIFSSKEDSNVYIQYFKDDTTAFNNQKKEEFKGKGIINNAISSYLMNVLKIHDVKNHFIELISPREQLIKKVKIIPIEFVVRNIAAGSLCKRLGIEKATVLPKPITEFYYKKDELNDPMICEDHIDFLKLISKDKLENVRDTANIINKILINEFKNININLVDIKLEFGFDMNNNIILSDEISPDTCRLWDINSNKSLDKDIFRNSQGDLISSYKEVARRFKLATL